MDLKEFIGEMRGDPATAEFADELAHAFAATNREGVTNRHARAFMKAVAWIAGHSDRTPYERFEKILRLSQIDTPVCMSLKLWTGWS